MNDLYNKHAIVLSEVYEAVELHVYDDGRLPKLFGNDIKAAGGDYTECRGHQHQRFVTIPATKDELIAQVCRRFGAKTAILRGPTEFAADLAGIENRTTWRRLDDQVLLNFDKLCAVNPDPIAVLLTRMMTRALLDEAWARARELREERLQLQAQAERNKQEWKRKEAIAYAAPRLLAALKRTAGNDPIALALIAELEGSTEPAS